jgi:hypothetical protein
MPKSKRKKSRGPVYQKLDTAKLVKLNTNKIPDYSYCRRAGSDQYRDIKSHITSTQFVPAIKSMMNPVTLAQESEETRNEIIAKSKRIAIAYNKGAYQYLSDDADVKTIGRKNPI